MGGPWQKNGGRNIKADSCKWILVERTFEEIKFKESEESGVFYKEATKITKKRPSRGRFGHLADARFT
jgi:hypothetical protein